MADLVGGAMTVASLNPYAAGPFIDYHVDSSDASTYTFSNVFLGRTAANRVVFVVVFITANGAGITINSVSIAGTNATIESVSSSSTLGNVAICYRAFGGAEFGDIVVSLSASSQSCLVAVYAYNTDGTGIADELAGSAGIGTSTSTANLAVQSGGILFDCVLINSDINTNYSWNGINSVIKDIDVLVGDQTRRAAIARIMPTESIGTNDMSITWPSSTTWLHAALSWDIV